MKTLLFEIRSPAELGDKVEVSPGEIKTITDIVCVQHCKNGAVALWYEFNNLPGLYEIHWGDKVGKSTPNGTWIFRLRTSTEAGVQNLV